MPIAMIFSEMLDKKGDCDDILIIRNGLITDMSYANVAFFDGTQWLTPRIPLLAGTCRERLLETGPIREADIADIRPGPVFDRFRDQCHAGPGRDDLPGIRYHSLIFESMMIVTGPSLTRLTSIMAPKTPV